MSNVFISYARSDSEIARDIADSLRQLGVNVWLDAETIVEGANFSQAVTNQIRTTDAVVLLLSENARRGRWVERELELIIEQAATVVPVLLDDHAKENWIWPLVSDRNAFTLRDRSDVDSLTKDIHRWIDKQSNPLLDSSQSAAPERGGSETPSSGGAKIATQSNASDVELVISRDFETFSDEDQERLLKAIKSLMEIGDVKIVRVQKG